MQEPQLYNTTDFLPLIGKYLADFRTYTGQTAPKDPWGTDYIIRPEPGTVVCSGINGTEETAITAREAAGDDVVKTYKPPYFVSSAKGVNATTVEVVFSRKTDDTTVPVNAVTINTGGAGSSTSKQRVSPTIYRFRFTLPNGFTNPGNGSNRQITLTNTIKAQDNRQLDFDKNPESGSNGNIATFTY
nr:hypothetical protein [Candidatus Ozemobacteraceae bacterium]